MNRFRTRLWSFVILSLLTGNWAWAQEKPERHVFLLIGQSNMAGRATIEAADKRPAKGVFLWNIGANAWESAIPPYNLYSPARKDVKIQRLNCGPSFAKSYLEKHPDVEVGIVCAARGGTSIRQWNREEPDDFKLYHHALQATRAALANGKGELKGVLWHQGESDSGKRLPIYPKKLSQLVSNLRADLKSEKLPFVFGQIGSWKPGNANFNEMIVKQQLEIPFSACVLTKGLESFDGSHFDTEGQRELGKRYAAEIETLLRSKPIQ